MIDMPGGLQCSGLQMCVVCVYVVGYNALVRFLALPGTA